MKTRTLAANLLARTAIVALVAITAAFFAGCGEKAADDDDDDDRKTEKKIDDEDDDDEDDGIDAGEESESGGRTATSRKKLSIGKKNPDLTKDEAERSVPSGKKSKKDLSLGKGSKQSGKSDEKPAGNKTSSKELKAAKELQAARVAIKEKKFGDAAKNLQSASNKGDSEATLILAFLYGAGKGVEKDEDRATTLLEKAADSGNVKAKFLSVMKEIDDSGEDPDEDAKKQLKNLSADLKKLAEAGDADGMALYALSLVTTLDPSSTSEELGEVIKEVQKWSDKARENGSFFTALDDDDED